MGFFSFIGQIFLTLAYQKHSGALVGILHYVGLIYALGIGFYFYDEVPDVYQIVGMLLITGAVIFHKLHSIKVQNES